MKLSREEEAFLRHWIYDEAHYQDGPGLAKRLQLEHGVKPVDLAALIAAALPDTADQETAGQGPPPATVPMWPWSDKSLLLRLAQAKAALAGQSRNHSQTAPTA